MAERNPKSEIRNPKLNRLVPALLNWFARNARDLPWRRTRDPYAIWVSEIMLQQTQVKTVIPYWTAWMKELPTIEAAAKASSDKIYKLWEGLGYYSRARNLQKAAQQIVANRKAEFHEALKNRDSQRSSFRKTMGCRFPETFQDVLALPGIGRYTAGAICSIAFDQPTPILDGNVIRVLTRVIGIQDNPREKKTNALLWKLAGELVVTAGGARLRRAQINSNSQGSRDSCPTKHWNCSHLNQSLMELGALVCLPRNPKCEACPVKRFCVALQEDRVTELPNLEKRDAAVARHFAAFVTEREGRFLVRQRPAGVVNAHLWEFPNIEILNGDKSPHLAAKAVPGTTNIQPLCTVKHSITRYRITLEAFRASPGRTSYASPHSDQAKSGTRIIRPSESGVWKTPAQMERLAFTAAHKKLASAAINCILSGR